MTSCRKKINRIACPQNCEALTKVKVNQLIWDNLSVNVRSQNLRIQKVQTSDQGDHWCRFSDKQGS